MATGAMAGPADCRCVHCRLAVSNPYHLGADSLLPDDGISLGRITRSGNSAHAAAASFSDEVLFADRRVDCVSVYIQVRDIIPIITMQYHSCRAVLGDQTGRRKKRLGQSRRRLFVV